MVRLPDTVFAMLRSQAAIDKCPMQHKLLNYIWVGLEVDRDWGMEDGKRLGQHFWDQ